MRGEEESESPLRHHEQPEEEAESTKSKKKSKKRKREKHNTTTVPETETIRAKVSFIHEKPDKTPPLVGYFPSGYNPQSGGNDEGSEVSGEPRVRVYRNTNEKKNKTGRLEMVVSPAGSGVEFVGTSYSGEAMAPQFCQYAVGVFDKDSQTLKIVPVAANKIFRLEPRVDTSEFDDKDESNVELSAEQQANMRAMLDTRYGTKKSVRQAKKVQAMNKENDPESRKDLEQKIKSVKINMDALESSTTESVLNIPPYNSSATSPEEAYPLDKIILKGEWDFLQDIYQLVQAEEEVKSSAYPSFICNRIHRLREIKDEDEKKILSCIFSYITHLVKFKDQNSMDGAASAKHHKIPSILRQKFSTKFSSPELKRLADDKIHLLISYVLVLTLHADNFRTNPTDIAKDLRMSEVKLRDHFENLGCKLSREKNMLLATLPIPLQFPKAKLRRRR